MSQSSHGTAGTTNVDLSVHGNLDWAAWNGGGANPNSSMEGGNGFVGFTATGASTFGSGFSIVKIAIVGLMEHLLTPAPLL